MLRPFPSGSLTFDSSVVVHVHVVERGSIMVRERGSHSAFALWRTFRGSSGGAVFDIETRELVGIHISELRCGSTGKVSEADFIFVEGTAGCPPQNNNSIAKVDTTRRTETHHAGGRDCVPKDTSEFGEDGEEFELESGFLSPVRLQSDPRSMGIFWRYFARYFGKSNASKKIF